MSNAAASPLEEMRDVLFGDEREEIIRLRTQVNELTLLVERLEALVLEQEPRAIAVGEVLVEAVATPQETPGDLGSALRPEIELAVHESARVDSSVLAAALYPVMGPAMRQMIAALFTTDRQNPGETFIVDRVLLIERETGLLLAGAHRNPEDADESDVVSGMLDAIRLFVQDAFDSTEHDGLRDLRVGDTSVLVEWGPRAVLASVTSGIPSEEYRTSAALTLEQLHRTHGEQLAEFTGDVSAFDDALDSLGQLREQGEPDPAGPNWALIVGTVVLVALLVLLIVWLV